MKRLLGDGFQFKEKGNFLIIQKLKTDERLIGGYISDKKTGQGVANATVYDKKSLKSATTDRYGYYEIISREPIKELSVAKFDYTDTIFQVKSLAEGTPQYIDASLLPRLKSGVYLDLPPFNLEVFDRYDYSVNNEEFIRTSCVRL